MTENHAVAVHFDNVSKRFGRTVAVDQFSLEVVPGEILVLLGPSGCGKTTLLRMLAGLEAPDEGEIYIGQAQTNGVAPGKRNIAMVFQDYSLYPHMTVRRNMGYPLEVAKIPGTEIAQRVRDMSQLLGLSDLLDRLPSQLSGGEAQRVAVGKAIIRHPRLFLLDEPLSNLDPQIRYAIGDEIQALQRKIGVTTIMVTHDQEEAAALGDRIAIMKSGSLQQSGTFHELFYNPANRFVAEFLSTPSLNMLTGYLKGLGNSYAFVYNDVAIPVGCLASGEVVNSHLPVTLAFRTTAVGITDEHDAKGSLEGTVVRSRPSSTGTTVQILLKGSKPVEVSISGAKDTRNVGDRVSIALSVQGCFLFQEDRRLRLDDSC